MKRLSRDSLKQSRSKKPTIRKTTPPKKEDMEKLAPTERASQRTEAVFDWYVNSQIFRGKKMSKADLAKHLKITVYVLTQEIAKVEKRLEKIFSEDEEFPKLLSRLCSKTELHLDENRSLILSELHQVEKSKVRMLSRYEDLLDKSLDIEDDKERKFYEKRLATMYAQISEYNRRADYLRSSLFECIKNLTEFISIFKSSESAGQLPTIGLNVNVAGGQGGSFLTPMQAMEIASSNNSGILPSPVNTNSSQQPRDPKKPFKGVNRNDPRQSSTDKPAASK